MKRALWEALAVLVAVAAMFGLWKWAEVNAQRAVGEHVQRSELEAAQLRKDSVEWAARLAEDQAEAVFQAFAAGIQPAVMAGSKDALLVSKQQLLHLPQLAFVHLLKPDGTVIFSSDEKLTTAGAAGERARWALSAPEMMRRPGEIEGTLELAAPIEGLTETEAVLWMGYDTSELASSTRPGSLASTTSPSKPASSALPPPEDDG